jgi:hypothetical protein
MPVTLASGRSLIGYCAAEGSMDMSSEPKSDWPVGCGYLLAFFLLLAGISATVTSLTANKIIAVVQISWAGEPKIVQVTSSIKRYEYAVEYNFNGETREGTLRRIHPIVLPSVSAYLLDDGSLEEWTPRPNVERKANAVVGILTIIFALLIAGGVRLQQIEERKADIELRRKLAAGPPPDWIPVDQERAKR